METGSACLVFVAAEPMEHFDTSCSWKATEFSRSEESDDSRIGPSVALPPAMTATLKRPLPPGFPLPKQETERLLIERLQNSTNEEDYFRWLLFVVAFYRGIEKIESARALLQLFLESSKEAEQKAHCHLALGQIATDEQHIERALNHFTTALGFNPVKAKVGYVLHNNVSYCLNQLGRYKDAEHHCRMAIGIDARRASAYRNLGISLEGQQNTVAAVWALVEAIKLDSTDERARQILKRLIAEHPLLTIQCPWIEEGFASSHPDVQSEYAI
jgi:tetratricopeptide (TPR) repeat protein